MLTWLAVMLATLHAACRSQRELALENLALPQQLAALTFCHPRPRLTEFRARALRADVVYPLPAA